MPGLTSGTVINALKTRPGALSSILHLEDFAEPDGVADGLAQKWTRSGGETLKATQLRRFFHAIKKVERSLKGRETETQALPPEVRQQLLPVMPELAYARGRKLIPQDFYDLMKTCLQSEKLQTVQDFNVFVAFLTAILAYHKYHDKK